MDGSANREESQGDGCPVWKVQPRRRSGGDVLTVCAEGGGVWRGTARKNQSVERRERGNALWYR